MRIPLFFSYSLLFSGLVAITTATYNRPYLLAETPEIAAPAPFLSVWRLLSSQEKQQFLAGYIQGWKDASRVTDIAITYVRENPKEAITGLQKVRELYDLSDLSPSVLAREVDEFYKDPDNQSATLSSAVTAARASIR